MNERHAFTVPRATIPAVLAAALIGFVFVLALRATAGLEWPCESDFFRDMGGAQAILDGQIGSDPAYLGEVHWFNPLQPSLFASLARLTGLPLHVLYARAGPYLNLLGPLAFLLLAWQLLGRWGGLAALGAYLLLGNPAVPSWFQATYSPWAWPMDFAQGFFYLTVAAYLRAAQTQRQRWDVATGVLLGLTFLAHTAPTLVFVGMLLLLTVCSGREERRRAIQRLFVVGAVSLLIASPFLGPLLVRYHLHVLNTAPSEHAPIGLGFVLKNLFALRVVLAVLGVWTLVRWRSPTPVWADDLEERQDGKQRAGVLLALAFVPALLLGYGLLAQGLQNRGFAPPPRVLPTYHFLLYLKAAESLLFGLGLAAAARFLAIRWRGNGLEGERATGPLLVGMLICLIAVNLPRYLNGRELTGFREDSQHIGAQTDRIALYHWLRNETAPTDVFLADKGVGFWAVSAADRKVVCLDDQYSNIYVDFHERDGDLDRLYASLQDEDVSAFDSLAAKYRLTYVILNSKVPQEAQRVPPERLGSERFTPVFAEGSYRVYRWKGDEKAKPQALIRREVGR